jgi:hypothetical protein
VLVLSGRARATFERAIAYANDIGLLAEEVDLGSGELLGNLPQAFSHIGLVNAAWAIAQAEQATTLGSAEVADRHAAAAHMAATTTASNRKEDVP